MLFLIFQYCALSSCQVCFNIVHFQVIPSLLTFKRFVCLLSQNSWFAGWGYQGDHGKPLIVHDFRFALHLGLGVEARNRGKPDDLWNEGPANAPDAIDCMSVSLETPINADITCGFCFQSCLVQISNFDIAKKGDYRLQTWCVTKL